MSAEPCNSHSLIDKVNAVAVLEFRPLDFSKDLTLGECKVQVTGLSLLYNLKDTFMVC